MAPRLLDHTNWWLCFGWHAAAVMTSVRSSIFVGLMSTTLKDVFETCRFQ